MAAGVLSERRGVVQRGVVANFRANHRFALLAEAFTTAGLGVGAVCWASHQAAVKAKAATQMAEANPLGALVPTLSFVADDEVAIFPRGTLLLLR
jgi:hypothetical protein